MRILRETPWYGYLLVLLSFAAGAAVVLFAFRFSEKSESQCLQVYDSIEQIFKPFLVRPPANEQERQDRILFRNAINDGRDSCG